MSVRTIPIASSRRPVAVSAMAALAAAIVLSGVLAGAAPAVAEEAAPTPEVTWGVRTASSADLGDARENYAYRVEAGQALEDAIVIANYDTTPLELDVYAADGFTTTSGQLDVQKRDASQVSIGKWTLPAVNRVTIPPGEAIEVPFTLAVPANAEPGDYAGAVVTSLAQPEVEDGLAVDRRLGIRIHLRVRGELAPALSIDDLKVEYSGTLNPFGTGDAAVSYTVRNSGNVRLSAKAAVRLAGPFGVLPVDATGVEPVPELLPGESWRVEVPVAGVFPAFALGATVSLEPQAPEDTVPAPAAVSETAWTPAVPWTLLALLVLVAGAVVAWVLVGRRRRAARAAAEDARVQAAVEQALREREAAAADASSADVSSADVSEDAPDVSEPEPSAPDVSEPEPEPEPEPSAPDVSEPEPEPEPADAPVSAVRE